MFVIIVKKMGYAKSGQDTAGIHFRLYSRAFILADERGTRIVMVNCDLGMISQIVKIEVSILVSKIYSPSVEEPVLLGSRIACLAHGSILYPCFSYAKIIHLLCFLQVPNCLNPNTTPAVNSICLFPVSFLT